MGELFGVSSNMSANRNHEENPDLRHQLEEAQKRNESLEAERKQLEEQLRTAGLTQIPTESSVDITPINEADTTLRRLVQRIAMILQAEKIVIMFYDRETGELIGIPPAFGVEEDRLSMFRVRATQGISGQVYRDSSPLIFHDAMNDPRTLKDLFSILHVQNGVSVPLVIEKRDEENRVVDRNVIGVLHAFNKRHGEDFNEEDVRLLERMARNVGSIIANLQMYREVVEEREELLQTFESLQAGLVLINAEGRISQINSSARTIFSVNGEALGKAYLDVMKNESMREVYEKTISGAEFGNVEMSIPIAGADRVYQVQSAQVKNEDGKDLGIVIFFNDITEMKNIERLKSSFISMASHELRTPLTAIKGFVSTLIMDDTFPEEDRHEFYSIIDQECDRLTRLINDLLNTSRIEAGESLKPHYKRVDVRAMLEKVITIQRQATRNHTLILEAPENLAPIIADEDKLDQILTNLMNNAIKYAPNGGDIILSATVKDDDLLFAVKDQGMGIPHDHLNKVFERFHRVDNEDNRKIYGTGLGLYLVKHLVEQVHLGRIWVESEVGVGSTFFFTIPLELDIEKAKEMNA
jgi:two-component system phosphate regulon sensor histidine kinase PhoR